jgi:hypothetical protein
MNDSEKELMDLCTKVLVGDSIQTFSDDSITPEELNNKIKEAIEKLDKITPKKITLVAGVDAYMFAEQWLFDHGYNIPKEPPIRIYELTLWRSERIPPDAVKRLPERDIEEQLLSEIYKKI